VRLWIAEKPDAGRKIAVALGGGSQSGGSITTKNGDVVTWAIGHLLEGLMPHEYDERWRKWNINDLPIMPKRFQSKAAEGKSAQLKVVESLIGRATEVVIAADAGREGEYIAWEILDHAGWKGPCLRFWTSALNPAGIAKAIGALIDDTPKKPMYVAAKLRSAIDWADGMNYSRAYNLRITEYGDKALSLGRVQTATLAILVDRDLEIANFKPTDYFELKALYDLAEGPLALIHSPPENRRITTRTKAEDIAAKTRQVDAPLRLETKPRTMAPPTPYNLTELQKAASARWGWSAKKTLDIAQKLYEAGMITYPRTSSGYLNEIMKADMPKHVAAVAGIAPYAEHAKTATVIRNAFFNDKKIEDHHGIIPTEELAGISGQELEAKKLFDLIARRFLAALMPDAEGFTTTISSTISGYLFKASGLAVHKAGWKAVWGKGGEPVDRKPKGEEEETLLPPVKDGTMACNRDVEVLAKTTRPPPCYTEGTLLGAMESAGKKHDDAEVRDVLNGLGIGTVATRPDMIEKIKYRGFATIEGKKIISTQRGRELISIIREDGNRLADVAATAELEREMRAVEKDPKHAAKVWRDYAAGLTDEIEKLKRSPARRKLTPTPNKGNGSTSSGNTTSTSSAGSGSARGKGFSRKPAGKASRQTAKPGVKGGQAAGQ
jgi:DNA topoisomerase-3